MSVLRRSVTSKGGRRRSGGLVVAVAASVTVVVALTTSGASATQQSALALPRNQTFYMSGSQWAPYGDVNPAKTWDYSRHGRPRIRNGIPLQSVDRQLHPMARHRRGVAVEERLRHEHPQRREVQRRHDDDGERRQVQLRPAQDPDSPAECALGVDGSPERQGRREQGHLHVCREAGLPAVRLLPLQRGDRPAARLQQVEQDGHHDGQPRPELPRRHRPVHVRVGGEPVGADVRVEAEEQLVGDEGAGPQAGSDVRRRHPQLVERGRVRQLPGRATSTSSTTSPRGPRSAPRRRPSTARRRTTSARIRPGSSRTRRGSRSTTPRSAGLSHTRST